MDWARQFQDAQLRFMREWTQALLAGYQDAWDCWTVLTGSVVRLDG
jgi:hypothetical protein